MTETHKYFSVTEADSLIPALSGILAAARELKQKIEAKVDDWRRRREGLPAAEEAVLRGQVDFLAAQLEATLQKVIDLGCFPKDLELGLVDFPCRIEGREAYLCWRLGERRIEYWHGLTDGFQGRQRLTGKEH